MVKAMSVIKLEQVYICPHCGGVLRYRSGGAVSVAGGQVDMSTTLPKYVCDKCNVYFQELLRSGFFDEFELPQEWRQQPEQPKQPERKLRRTGDIEPMELHKDANGQCVCPRCGEMMDFVEGQPVRIVDGKPDMENVKDHFHCPHCDSVYRRIATTDYFQWSEK